MSKVTVLMAVYNAEKFLEKSVGSLLGQTLQDIQIVCIDDASTDSSLQMLHRFASADRRVTVLHLDTNHGQAYARNRGMAVADGEFVAAIDADDWLAPDALEQAMRVVEQHPLTDSVLFDVRYAYPDGRLHGYHWQYPTGKYAARSNGSFEVMDGYDAFVASLGWQIHGWGLVRAEIMRKYPYDETCRFYSDDNSTHLHFLASREVRCSDGIYYYRQNPESTTHHVGVGRMDWMRAADNFRRQLEAMGMGKDIMEVWEWERWKIVVGCYWFYFLHRRRLSTPERRYCLAEIRKAWAGTNTSRLKGRRTTRPGWSPLTGHWRLFRMEEEAYFGLRYLLGRR